VEPRHRDPMRAMKIPHRGVFPLSMTLIIAWLSSQRIKPRQLGNKACQRSKDGIPQCLREKSVATISASGVE
jgi:hypothetical protein